MVNHIGTNGSVNGNGSPSSPEGEPSVPEPISATQGPSTGSIEYYILCPQRATEVPGLITHLISRDICDKRQAENYHKCPNCVRSRIWRERMGLPVDEPATASR